MIISVIAICVAVGSLLLAFCADRRSSRLEKGGRQANPIVTSRGPSGSDRDVNYGFDVFNDGPATITRVDVLKIKSSPGRLMSPNCAACGGKLVYRGKGRPRRYCETCVPSGSGTSAWREAWLAEHRDELEAERHRKHAEFMAEWRANLRERQRQIARNRRALERRDQVA